jgi:hypothetical protein
LTADVVREVFRRCVEDGWLTQQIAKELNARLIPTAYGRDAREILAGDLLGTRAPREGKRRRATQGIWRPGAVLRILHNSTYSGEHVYGPSHELAAGTGFAEGIRPSRLP